MSVNEWDIRDNLRDKRSGGSYEFRGLESRRIIDPKWDKIRDKSRSLEIRKQELEAIKQEKAISREKTSSYASRGREKTSSYASRGLEETSS
ncbi:hypothetical protein Ldro_0790, partial [Legionella drozanskii LLAP-1]